MKSSYRNISNKKSSFAGTAAVCVSHISKSFPRHDTGKRFSALNDVSFTVGQNETVCIAGANGSGKSILMNIIAGLAYGDTGSVEVCGRVGLVFQDADTQILGETPYEDVMFGVQNFIPSKNEADIKVREALEQTGLLDKAFFPARFLSGGEKRRLACAAVLALDCQIIIFDEPYANLDFDGVLQINSILQLLKSNNKTVIVLTHELEKSLALMDRFIVLYNGALTFDGTAEEGLSQPLEKWGIRNPLGTYRSFRDLIWKK